MRKSHIPNHIFSLAPLFQIHVEAAAILILLSKGGIPGFKFDGPSVGWVREAGSMVFEWLWTLSWCMGLTDGGSSLLELGG